MKKIYLIGCLLILLFLIDIFLHIYQPFGKDFYIIGDSLVIIFSLIAFVSGLYVYKIHGFSSIQGKALIFITLGTFFWFLGEFTWGIYEIVLGIEAPVASIADAFWIIGYPLFLLGFYYVLKLALTSLYKKRLIVLAIIIALVASFMTYLSMPTLTDIEMSFAEKASTAGYVIGDMLILVALMVVITYLIGSKFAKSWSIIFLAMLMVTIADIYYMNFLEIYETGNLIDILWDLDYILLAFGFFYHRETVKEILTTSKDKKFMEKRGSEKTEIASGNIKKKRAKK